jgi:hypothetical protein
MRISVILCPFAVILSLYSRLLKKIQRRGARKSTSGGVHRRYVDARRLSATKHMGLFQQPAMRLANSAGEAMARDSGTMKALMAMSPQMAAE